jgi:hypothetical protein
MNYVAAAPAYGRDYQTEAQVRAAWAAGNDFRCIGRSAYINKEDADRYGVLVGLMFDNGMQSVLIEPQPPGDA